MNNCDDRILATARRFAPLGCLLSALTLTAITFLHKLPAPKAVIKVDLKAHRQLYDKLFHADASKSGTLSDAYFYRRPDDEILGKVVIYNVLSDTNATHLGVPPSLSSAYVEFIKRLQVTAKGSNPMTMSIRAKGSDGVASPELADSVAGHYLEYIRSLSERAQFAQVPVQVTHWAKSPKPSNLALILTLVFSSIILFALRNRPGKHSNV